MRQRVLGRINPWLQPTRPLWLLFGVSYAVGLVFEGATWILSGLAAFAAYKAAVMLGFCAIAPAADSTRAVSLLLLRVFSLGKRSEELFDAVTRHWRYLGHVQLITGPDLATATVEPHEFLAFLSGKLDLQFIDGTTDFPFLEKTLNDAWAGMRSDSPNRQGSGKVRIVRLDDSGGAGLLTLMRHLCPASDAERAPSMSAAAS